MTNRKENIASLLLMILGVIIVPVLFIWKADNIFALTIKTLLSQGIGRDELDKLEEMIITPHPGEAARLLSYNFV